MPNQQPQPATTTPLPQISQEQLLAILSTQPDLLAGIGATINQVAENKTAKLEEWKIVNNWVEPEELKQQTTDLINSTPPENKKDLLAHIKKIQKLYNHENPEIPEELKPTKSKSGGKATTEKLQQRYAKNTANNSKNLFCKNSTHNKNGEAPKPKIKGKCDYYCRSETTLKKHEASCKFNK